MNFDVPLIRQATQDEHKEILAVAKTSKYTRDFGSHMFSSEGAYEKGWITVAVHHEKIVGLACVRHKVRAPETMLYFVTVLPDMRSQRIGERLLQYVMDEGPHSRMALNVMKENEAAVRFYRRLGFTIVGEALDGDAHRMERDFAEELK